MEDGTWGSFFSQFIYRFDPETQIMREMEARLPYDRKGMGVMVYVAKNLHVDCV